MFEAAHLRVHGENVLDDALEFTTFHLKEHMKSNLGSPLVDLVGRSLKYPLRKSLNRLVARHYISIYHKFDRHNQVLLNMAKTDFNLVEKVHQVELGHITRYMNYLHSCLITYCRVKKTLWKRFNQISGGGRI